MIGSMCDIRQLYVGHSQKLIILVSYDSWKTENILLEVEGISQENAEKIYNFGADCWTMGATAIQNQYAQMDSEEDGWEIVFEEDFESSDKRKLLLTDPCAISVDHRGDYVYVYSDEDKEWLNTGLTDDEHTVYNFSELLGVAKKYRGK